MATTTAITSIREFNMTSDMTAGMLLIKEQWNMNYSKTNTDICNWLYLLEILRASKKLFVLIQDTEVIGMTGFSDGLKYNFWWNVVFQIVRLFIWMFYDRQIFAIYRMFNMYRQYFYLCDGELTMIVIQKKHRGKGYGRFLFDKICRETKNIGYKRLLIATYEHYCDVSFYDSVGCRIHTSFLEPDFTTNTPCMCFLYIKDLLGDSCYAKRTPHCIS